MKARIVNTWNPNKTAIKGVTLINVAYINNNNKRIDGFYFVLLGVGIHIKWN